MIELVLENQNKDNYNIYGYGFDSSLTYINSLTYEEKTIIDNWECSSK